MCENEKKKYHSIEMTTGSLWKNILLFSLPLMGSQVLEVLFNLSDVAVVGRFADYMALGAVGSTTLLVTLLDFHWKKSHEAAAETLSQLNFYA